MSVVNPNIKNIQATPSLVSYALLKALNAPINPLNVSLLNAMQQAEGQWTSPPSNSIYNAANMHNPFNIRTNFTGNSATCLGGSWTSNDTSNQFCSGPTVSFQNWAQGLAATIAFWQNEKPDNAIISALQANGNVDPSQYGNAAATFFQAVGASGSFGQDQSSGMSYWQQNQDTGADPLGVAGFLPIPNDWTTFETNAEDWLANLSVGGLKITGPIGSTLLNNQGGTPSQEIQSLLTGGTPPNNQPGTPGTPGPTGCWWQIKGGSIIGNICIIKDNPWTSQFVRRIALGALGVVMIIFGALMVLGHSINVKISGLTGGLVK